MVRTKQNRKKFRKFPIINAHAAGIDIGSRTNVACIGDGPENIQHFGVYTEDHHAMAKWFEANGVQTIAMESTGFYWKQLFDILQSYGFEVILVHSSFSKNVSGKKTDIIDSHWLWLLHHVGLLRACFQPDVFTMELRTYTRHRANLIRDAARLISKMQKCMVLMNIQLPIAISDITGKSGQAIIQAIVSGERRAEVLADLAHANIKASREQLIKALTGQWNDQHLFELHQCWYSYLFYQQQLQQLDERIEQLLKIKLEATGQADMEYQPKKKKRLKKNSPNFDIAKYVFQLSNGIDLQQIDGVGLSFLLVLLSEVGIDLAKFPTTKHFVSWLALCPNKRSSANKILSKKARRSNNRLRQAFLQVANAVGNQKGTALSQFFRRIALRKGRKVAIMATARKLAIIVYNMLEKAEAYNPQQLDEYHQSVYKNRVNSIQRTIAKLGIKADELVFNN